MKHKAYQCAQQHTAARCTAAYHGDYTDIRTNITCGGYFFVEALYKGKGCDLMQWI